MDIKLINRGATGELIFVGRLDANSAPEAEEIVKQIEVGTKKTKGKYIAIVDRVEAIKYAIDMANKNDIIVLAGKGHETYQEINGEKHPFDEREIIKKIIK